MTSPYAGPLIYIEALPNLCAINVEINPRPTPHISARLLAQLRSISGVSSVTAGPTGDFYVQTANELFKLDDIAGTVHQIVTATARGELRQTVRTIAKPMPNKPTGYWIIQTDRQHKGHRLLSRIAGALCAPPRTVKYYDPGRYNILVWAPPDWNQTEVNARVALTINEYYDKL